MSITTETVLPATDAARELIVAELERIDQQVKQLDSERKHLRSLLEDQRGASVLYRLARALVQCRAVTSDDVLVEETTELIRRRGRVRRAEIIEHFVSERGVPLSPSRVDHILSSSPARFTVNARGWWTLVQKSQPAQRADGVLA